MSVTTKADEKIINAKNLISEAYKELLIVLDDETWGHSDLKEEYLSKVQEVALELLKLKRKL